MLTPNLNCRENFEKAVAALEHARFALAFSSGSATTALILQSLAQGSHVVSVSDVYGGTHRYFTKVAAAHGVQVTFSPSIEIDIAELIRPDETKLIWIESPSNPTLSLVDIRKVATVAHRHGIMVVVDNTFLSPYVQNPLDHGADIVIHSVTKYINGHSVSFPLFFHHPSPRNPDNWFRMSSWALQPSTPLHYSKNSPFSKTPSEPFPPLLTAGSRTEVLKRCICVRAKHPPTPRLWRKRWLRHRTSLQSTTPAWPRTRSGPLRSTSTATGWAAACSRFESKAGLARPSASASPRTSSL